MKALLLLWGYIDKESYLYTNIKIHPSGSKSEDFHLFHTSETVWNWTNAYQKSSELSCKFAV